MESIKKYIDPLLWQAISNSPFATIDYENLLANDPIKIRDAERTLYLAERPLPVPSELQVQNREIPSADGLHQIRVRTYSPKGKQNLPMLLYFHGGAFIYGTPEQYDFMFFQLAMDTNLLIVSVDYRLAPENPFPAGMDDGYTALKWLANHGAEIGGDKDNIIIGGSSAGATIAASITHLARDRKEIVIQHQYLLYPPMSHSLATSSMVELAHAPMQSKIAAAWMWKHYLQDQLSDPPQYAVPLSESDFTDLPDATIVVCALDPLKDEGKLYANKLKEAHVEVNLLEIQRAVHAFDFFDCPLSEQFYQQQVTLFQHIVKKIHEKDPRD
ncbi:alpha/beta hydrolase [Sphingobacterium corticibacter]|uniref:Alpha/beta hydrolase n=1 Tax=Sphingobacterium corticibacter TaxID=2171749 RepID=A0A2T8HMU5_9SPHI|nr:alpha/beta hydrolase [Sphingobacterium corticibacter]PVH26778.1 alpha/beta hydrolase [Sphingobacterium corticibacter]